MRISENTDMKIEEAQLIGGCLASDDETLKEVFSKVSVTDFSQKGRVIMCAIKEIWLEHGTIDTNAIASRIIYDDKLCKKACYAFCQNDKEENYKDTLERDLYLELNKISEIRNNKEPLSAIAESLHANKINVSFNDLLDTAKGRIYAGVPVQHVAASIADDIERIAYESDTIDCFHFENPQIAVTPLITRDGIPVMARGNIHFVIGAKKSYKSTIMAKLISTALGADPKDTLGFERTAKDIKVLHCDTEQESADLKECVGRILKDARMDSTSQHAEYKVYRMMQYEPSERLERTLLLIRTLKPDIVAIDGLADYVLNINNLEECTLVIQKLLIAAETNRSAIVALLHFNPKSDKARGHLGTLLMNKAWGGLALNRDKNGLVKVYNSGLTRKAPINDFHIYYDDEIGDIVETKKTYERELTKREKDKSERVNSIVSMVRAAGKLSHGEIARTLMLEFNISQKNKTTATRLISYAHKTGAITKLENGEYALPESAYLFDNNDNNEDEDDDAEEI